MQPNKKVPQGKQQQTKQEEEQTQEEQQTTEQTQLDKKVPQRKQQKKQEQEQTQEEQQNTEQSQQTQPDKKVSQRKHQKKQEKEQAQEERQTTEQTQPDKKFPQRKQQQKKQEQEQTQEEQQTTEQTQALDKKVSQRKQQQKKQEQEQTLEEQQITEQTQPDKKVQQRKQQQKKQEQEQTQEEQQTTEQTQPEKKVSQRKQQQKKQEEEQARDENQPRQPRKSQPRQEQKQTQRQPNESQNIEQHQEEKKQPKRRERRLTSEQEKEQTKQQEEKEGNQEQREGKERYARKEKQHKQRPQLQQSRECCTGSGTLHSMQPDHPSDESAITASQNPTPHENHQQERRQHPQQTQNIGQPDMPQERKHPVGRDFDLKLLDKDLQKRLSELKLNKHCTIKHATVVETIKNIILEYLQKKFPTRPNWEIIPTGSYYDKSKINKPDEYDCMMVCSIRPRLQGIDYCGKEEIGDSTYCTISPPGNETSETTNPIHPVYHRQLYTKPQDEKDPTYISPKSFMEYIANMVQKAIKEKSEIELKHLHISYDLKNTRCPAVTLIVKAKPGNVHYTETSFSIDVVPAIRILEWPKPAKEWQLSRLPDLEEKIKKPDESHIYPCAIPKISLCEALKPNEECKFWQISFSRAEKEIIFHANRDSGGSACPKSILRLLKSDLQEFERNNFDNNFCSFHIKTIFLYLLDENKDSAQWAMEKLCDRYIEALRRVIEHLEKAELNHYFIRDANLFEPELVSQEELDAVKNYFMQQLDKYLKPSTTEQNRTPTNAS